MTTTYRGAPLGQPDVVGSPDGHFSLVRVRINSGGYGPDGTYWGLGQPLYRYSSGGASGHLRASSRDAAKAAVRGRYPFATFYR